GNRSREHQPSHIYTEAGEYIVALTVFSKGDFKNHTSTIVVSVDSMKKRPTACFSTSSETGILHTDIHFQNCSKYQHRSFWEFGDGNVSYEHSPEHSFSAEGTYNVNLIVYSEGDLFSDTITRSIEIIVTTYLVTEGLVAFYPFTRGSVFDHSGNENHGNINGPSLAYDRHDNSGNAYDFDGINDYVEVSNNNGDFILTESWTLQAWVYPHSSSGHNPIICKQGVYGSALHNFYLNYGHVDQNGQFELGFDRASDGLNFKVNSGFFTSNNWYHVVGAYDGSNLLLYINGSLVASNFVGAILPQASTTTPLRIGNGSNPGHPNHGVFDGVIDEVRIYDRALSEAEIQILYNE
ncbi:MAG: hypothetical protein IH946_05885, partial [Bacteroidetes bacterium]|nr:hypothetical protein [Bacteroidota bacterium]